MTQLAPRTHIDTDLAEALVAGADPRLARPAPPALTGSLAGTTSLSTDKLVDIARKLAAKRDIETYGQDGALRAKDHQRLRFHQERELDAITPGNLYFNREGITPETAALQPQRLRYKLIPTERPDGSEMSVHGDVLRKILPSDFIAEDANPSPSQTIHKSFAEQQKTLNEMLPFRIRVGWRFVREFGRLKGLFLHDEPLMEALAPRPSCSDPWVIPVLYESPDSPQAIFGGSQVQEILATVEAAQGLPDDLLYRRFNFETSTWDRHPGLAMLPPPVPMRWWNDQCETLDDYKVEGDLLLQEYVRAVSLVTERLYVEQGSTADMDQGRYGLVGLLEPELIRMAFPTRLQIVTWEELLTEQTLALVVEKGHYRTRQSLRHLYGLHDREIALLLKLALKLAQSIATTDTEESRAVMVMRLEEYIRRSKESLDVRAELSGLKQLSLVQGLGDDQTKSIWAGMVDAVRSVSDERHSGRLDSNTKFVESTSSAV